MDKLERVKQFLPAATNLEEVQVKVGQHWISGHLDIKGPILDARFICCDTGNPIYDDNWCKHTLIVMELEAAGLERQRAHEVSARIMIKLFKVNVTITNAYKEATK